jgi:ABC-2 type transport system ATP-binding protein
VPAITVHELRKSYGDFEAVKGISFDVAEGEVFALLGPNGAGKTTTTEILEGYRPRTGGSAEVLGFDPGAADRRMRQRIGIVLEECGIQLELTVEETIEMYRSYYPKPRSVDELIELVQLDAKRDARIKTLSGGQRRRVDLALALAGDPDLIFLDEPTTGFDPSARRHSWDAIRNLCSLGKTVFLTTHFMDEAQALADRVAVVAGGLVVAEGTPSNLGGRDSAAAQISFGLPAGVAVSELPALGELRVDGDVVTVATTSATVTMHQLTSWAVARSLDLPGLTLSQPTLEDVYLQLTAAPDAEGVPA